MVFSFNKYQGSGNDFVILDNRNGEFNILSASQIKRVCDRRFGVGADGLMLLNTKEGYDFEMKYYNSDGAESTMCGNGGRCLIKFAASKGIIKDTYRFMAIDGEHDASITGDGWVKLKMKDVTEVTATADGHHILDTGSPHYVMVVPNAHATDVSSEGRRVRFSDSYKMNGINVNFTEVQQENIYVRTYERGVEDETLSCGTGVTAAALVYVDHNVGFHRVNVQTPGGNLAVEFNKQQNNLFTDIWLCGPATFVFSGEIKIQ